MVTYIFKMHCELLSSCAKKRRQVIHIIMVNVGTSIFLMDISKNIFFESNGKLIFENKIAFQHN